LLYCFYLTGLLERLAAPTISEIMMEADRSAVLGRHGQYNAAAGNKARVGREGLLRLNHIDKPVVSGGRMRLSGSAITIRVFSLPCVAGCTLKPLQHGADCRRTCGQSP
jgi:hypothetical protein